MKLRCVERFSVLYPRSSILVLRADTAPLHAIGAKLNLILDQPNLV
jgi:hypothetical protein